MTLYGKMKKEAENLVQASRCPFQIVRLTKIMDPSTGFMQECCSRLKGGKSVKASAELPVAPLSSKWVGTALLQCLKSKNEGIFHLSPIDETSYYTLAKEIGARKGEPPEKIQKQSKKSLLKNCLWLPRYAKLSAKKSSESLGLKMPKWMDALKGVK
jgi:dTDP-4-dehydrorhamnose reductase